MALSATDIAPSFSPAALKLLADALLVAAKAGRSQAEPADLIKVLLAQPEIKTLYETKR